MADKKKSFWSKHKVLISVTTILFLAFLFVSAGIYFRVSFLLHEEIIIQVSPRYSSLEVERNEYKEQMISVEVQSTWMCNAECNYELRNIGTGEILASKNITVTGSEKTELEHWFGTDEYGYGQDYYTYTVTCKAIPTVLCSAENPERKRVSVITVNYEPSRDEKEAEEFLRERFQNLTAQLNTADTNILTGEARLEQISIKKDDLEDHANDSKQLLNEIRSSIGIITGSWNESNFLGAKQNYEELNVSGEAEELARTTNTFLEMISERIETHNQAVLVLDEIYDDRAFTNNLFETSKANNDLTRLFLDATTSYNSLTKSFNTDDFISYEELISDLSMVNDSFNDAKAEYVEAYLNSTEDYLDLFLGEFSACISNAAGCEPEEISSVLRENVSVTESFRHTNNKCLTASNVLGETSRITSEKQEVLGQIDSQMRAEAEKEKNKVMLSVILRYEEELIEGELENTSMMGRLQEYKENFERELNETTITSNYYPFSYNESLREYFTPIDMSRVELLDEKCLPPNETLFFEEPLRDLKEQPYDVVESNKTYSLPEVLAMCCAYNECRPCCEHGCEKNNPLVLLHGHAFIGRHTPEYSADAFNEMLDFFSEEKLYLPMSTLTPEKRFLETRTGDLGRNHKPIAMKATYYYIAYVDGPGYTTIISKSENIDTYAIRLEEMITWLKNATGSEEVDIVAHSMGGLVVRRYLQVFGEESVDRVIMIGTPNHGITPVIGRLCSVFGEERECRDMEEGSAFMNTLNQPEHIPGNVELHTIRGEGCRMEGGTGDGIVLGERVPLDYAENHVIRRDCDILQENMHTDMLSPEKYPEVYELITRILLR